MELIDQINEQLLNKTNHAMLAATKKIKDFDPKIQDILKNLYYPKKGCGDQLISKLYGVFLNSVLTQNRVVFLLSYRSFEEILKNDKNIRSRKTISGSDFKKFTNFLIINKHIKIEKLPKKIGKKSGVYSVQNPDVVGLIWSVDGLNPSVDVLNPNGYAEFYNKQMEQCTCIYEGFPKSEVEKLRSNTSHESESENESESGIEKKIKTTENFFTNAQTPLGLSKEKKEENKKEEKNDQSFPMASFFINGKEFTTYGLLNLNLEMIKSNWYNQKMFMDFDKKLKLGELSEKQALIIVEQHAKFKRSNDGQAANNFKQNDNSKGLTNEEKEENLRMLREKLPPVQNVPDVEFLAILESMRNKYAKLE